MIQLILTLAWAFAAQPEIFIETDGTVSVSLDSKHDYELVASVIADPLSYGRIEDQVTVTVIDEKNDCPVMEYSSKDERYTVKMCKSSNGFQLDLVESASLKYYQAIWKLAKTKQGTRIEYRIRVETKSYIPMFIVSRKLRGDVTTFFEKFQAHLNEKAKE